MLALASVWMGLAVLALSAAMVVYRPVFTDLTVLLVLYFGSPGSLCLAGLVLWAYRKEEGSDPGIAAQRKQAKVAIGLALVAAAIVYLLVIFSHKIEPLEHPASSVYHSPSKEAIAINDAMVPHANYPERPSGNARLGHDAWPIADAAQA